MSEELKKAYIRWGDAIVDRITKISHNRIAYNAIWGILWLAGGLVLGIPALSLKHEADKSYLELLIEYNQTDPWAAILLIVAIIAVVVIFVVNRIADKKSAGVRTINKVTSKGNENSIIQNSPNSRISK